MTMCKLTNHTIITSTKLHDGVMGQKAQNNNREYYVKDQFRFIVPGHTDHTDKVSAQCEPACEIPGALLRSRHTDTGHT